VAIAPRAATSNTSSWWWLKRNSERVFNDAIALANMAWASMARGEQNRQPVAIALVAVVADDRVLFTLNLANQAYDARLAKPGVCFPW
jgi:hypothetical protein